MKNIFKTIFHINITKTDYLLELPILWYKVLDTTMYICYTWYQELETKGFDTSDEKIF